jgi:hypothetical protein
VTPPLVTVVYAGVVTVVVRLVAPRIDGLTHDSENEKGTAMDADCPQMPLAAAGSRNPSNPPTTTGWNCTPLPALALPAVVWPLLVSIVVDEVDCGSMCRMGIETAEASSCGGEYSVVVATRGAPTFGEAPGGGGVLDGRDAAARSIGTRVRTAGGVGGAWFASAASLIAFIYAESI